MFTEQQVFQAFENIHVDEEDFFEDQDAYEYNDRLSIYQELIMELNPDFSIGEINGNWTIVFVVLEKTKTIHSIWDFDCYYKDIETFTNELNKYNAIAWKTINKLITDWYDI